MIPHSQRVIDHTRLYLERSKISAENGRIVFTNAKDKTVKTIPYRNTPFLLLGAGTSITETAVRLLASERVPLGFCGGSEDPSVGDMVWQLSSSNNTPSEYAKKWVKLWSDESSRLAAAKHFLLRRLQMSELVWASEEYLNPKKVITPDIKSKISACPSMNDVAALEASLTKSVHTEFAKIRGLDEFKRIRSGGSAPSSLKRVNLNLDVGNYLAHGFAASALASMGIPHELSVMSGKNRRGGLALDVADLIKDAIVTPEAFRLGTQDVDGCDAKETICKLAADFGVITFMIETIKECLNIESASHAKK